MASSRFLKLLSLIFLVASASHGAAQGVDRQTAPSVASQPAAAAAPASSPLQQPAPTSAAGKAADTEDLQRLLDTLTDDKARGEFIVRLRGLVEAQAQDVRPTEGREDWLAGATESLGDVSRSILGFAGQLEQLPDLGQRAITSLSDPATLGWLSGAIAMIAAVLAAALLVEWLAKRLLARPRRAIEGRSSTSMLARVFLLCVRTVLDILPIVAFAAAAYGVLAVVDLSFLVRLAVVTLVNANVLSRAIIAAGRAILAPGAPGLRLLYLNDENAAYGFLWLRRFTHAGVYGYFILHTGWLLGLTHPVYSSLGNLLALFIAGMSVVFIMQSRLHHANSQRRQSQAARTGNARQCRAAAQASRGILARARHRLCDSGLSRLGHGGAGRICLSRPCVADVGCDDRARAAGAGRPDPGVRDHLRAER
ncbi:hypothetical protein [Bradyrhizobium sp.]|uniref:hypothetical protein n=1 Tax=Bradyrhizobium sp. TaxID=376 RepID=UPI00273492D3|nr:hypothetical protein [Bradyrhizobium sp.]MDP3691388.1 hypothetical protein [Bradyrhizobium sp.]